MKEVGFSCCKSYSAHTFNHKSSVSQGYVFSDVLESLVCLLKLADKQVITILFYL